MRCTQEIEREGILVSTRHTRNPKMLFSTTCLVTTSIRNRLASCLTNRSTPRLSMQGTKKEVPGWNLFHSIRRGKPVISTGFQ